MQPAFLQNRTSVCEAQQKTYDAESSLLHDRLLSEGSFQEQLLDKRQGSSDKLRPRSSKGVRAQASAGKMPAIDPAKQTHPNKSEERTRSQQAARNLSSKKREDRFARVVQQSLMNQQANQSFKSFLAPQES